MANHTVQIGGFASEAAPLDWTVPAPVTASLMALRATFDGSGAASAFLPCVQIFSDASLLMSQTLSDSVAAGASADVTFHPFRKPATSAPAGASLPWAIATEAGYVAADYFVGRSPNPLSFRNFASSDPTAFAFVATNSPTAGDGDVTILRSGLYLVRLVVSSVLDFATTDPGYNWDMAVYARGQDGGGGLFFGPDLFPNSTVVQPVESYAFYLSPRDNLGAPNGNSMLARQEQHVSSNSWLNLPDSVVTWPVTVKAQFRHGLNDADVTNPPPYNLWLMRWGDANAAAPTT